MYYSSHSSHPSPSSYSSAVSALPGPFAQSCWMGSCESMNQAEWLMVGLPYDGTTSYRPGTRFGPEAIRTASWGVETYSPQLDRDLSAIKYYDAGDLDFPIGNREKILAQIYTNTKETLALGKKWLGIGGEHLVSFPAFQAYAEQYPDIGILHFDAHADLRDDFLGEPLSHATVLRRMIDCISPDRLVQVGIRSGPKEEFDWMKTHNTLVQSREMLGSALARLKNRPVYLTVDLDVLDPAVLPGTGTPEPGGMLFNELIAWLLDFSGLTVVGADVVELSPHYDPSGSSSVVAAKLIREILLLFSEQSLCSEQ